MTGYLFQTGSFPVSRLKKKFKIYVVGPKKSRGWEKLYHSGPTGQVWLTFFLYLENGEWACPKTQHIIFFLSCKVRQWTKY